MAMVTRKHGGGGRHIGGVPPFASICKTVCVDCKGVLFLDYIPFFVSYVLISGTSLLSLVPCTLLYRKAKSGLFVVGRRSGVLRREPEAGMMLVHRVDKEFRGMTTMYTYDLPVSDVGIHNRKASTGERE